MKSIELSKKMGGKIEIRSKIKLTKNNLKILYTPGVADVSKAIAKNKKLSKIYTIKKNTVAVISDGSAVLGLGNSSCGPGVLKKYAIDKQKSHTLRVRFSLIK